MWTSQKRVVAQAALREDQLVGTLALFNADGTPYGGTKAAVTALAPVATANAAQSVGVPTKAEFDAVVALANANKAAINAIITALKS